MAKDLLTNAEVKALNERFATAPTEEMLRWAWERFGARAAIGTSFQGAGLVMMHLAAIHGLPFPAFTLDTGLLFAETLDMKRRLEEFLGRPIEVRAPALTLEQQAEAHGPELWTTQPDLCCTLRKVMPLRARLLDSDCWISGVRRQQSDTRARTDLVELYLFDEASGRDLVKLNPMARWTRDAVWEYIRTRGIPYNPLHDRGYRSIGCRPCTRPAGEGGDERAGRWIGFDKVECGIHTFMPRKADFHIDVD